MGQHPRLSAAGPGEYQQRPLTMGDRLALGLVQALQQLLEVLCMGVLGHQIFSIDARSACLGGERGERSASRFTMPEPVSPRRLPELTPGGVRTLDLSQRPHFRDGL
jgi:hypothetical protein